jgi:aldose 1-epimerase
LEFRHEPGEWPWAYVANQRIAMIDGGAEIEVSVTNQSDSDMPAGLGLHPYFVRRERDSIDLNAHRMVTSSSDGIADDEAPFVAGEKQLDEVDGLDNLLLDHGGSARLRTNGVRCDLHADGAVGFHLYVPEQEKFFCVEPVSHPPNAFAEHAEEYALAPGDTRRLIMRLTVSPANAALVDGRLR